MKWTSAIGESPALAEVIDETGDRILEALGASPDLVVVFTSPHFGPEYRKIPSLVEAKLGASHVVGCSAGGVIGAGREVERRPGFSLTAALLPEVVLTPLRLVADDLPDLDTSPSAWREAVGVDPSERPNFVLLADPFSFPADLLLQGVDYAYPQSVVIGGLASGAARPGGNGLFLDGDLFTHGLVGVCLQGNVTVDTVVAQGCRPIGKPLSVTDVHDNLLLGLNGKPPIEALQEIWETLNERDRSLVQSSLHLGVVMDPLIEEAGAGDYLIRNVIGVDTTRGALAVGERLRNGQVVRFHLRDADTSAEDLERLLSSYLAHRQGPSAEGALLISCLGRGEHLYGRPDHDTGLFREKLGEVPLGGFFANGEIGPVQGTTYLHGLTSSFGIFRPKTPSDSPK